MIKSCYIHIPFCNNICSYCDFCKMYKIDKYVLDYLEALKKEIDIFYRGDVLKTLYVGGGTPSVLSLEELDIFFSYIKDLKLAHDYEFTFECNVSDINDNLLNKLKNNRVNRLSIGVQSFNIDVLHNIGRGEIPLVDKIKLAKKYFDNISIDLIYGSNNETIDDLKKDLELFISLDIPHISTYALILENNTILKANNYLEIDDDLSRKMYDLIRNILSKHGYIHYEISNFAKKGYMSKHNLTYWHNERYYGFGLGASGYIDDIRYTNTRSLNNYLNGNYHLAEDVITRNEDMENEMILGLRLIKGVSKKRFRNKYGINIEERFNVSKLRQNKRYYYVSKKDLFIQNSILIDFIES